MVKSVAIIVSGTVQGVFFRASAKKKADQLNIYGFVRNERDGSVFLEASGEEKNLNEFIEWCRVGPAHARVTECDVREIAAREFKDFQIQRY
jgi:acylphosphatase